MTIDLLNQLKHKRLLWQANQANDEHETLATNYAELDTLLRGGLPLCGVVAAQTDIGIGELRLFTHQLLTRQRDNEQLLVIIAPPHPLNPEALAEQGFDLTRTLIVQCAHREALWSAEQCLKSGCCHSVLLWHRELEVHQVKRLQLAAEKGNALNIIFRPGQKAGLSLPLPLAMVLAPHPKGLNIHITKHRGGRSGTHCVADMRHQWPELTHASPGSRLRQDTLANYNVG